MYKILVRPILEYCAQVLSYRKYFLKSIRKPNDLDTPNFYTKELEKFQTQALKTLINCPRNISPAVVRLLTGVEPIACRLDILKLRYYWKVTQTLLVSFTILSRIRKTCFRRITSDLQKKYLMFAVGLGISLFGMEFIEDMEFSEK